MQRIALVLLVGLIGWTAHAALGGETRTWKYDPDPEVEAVLVQVEQARTALAAAKEETALLQRLRMPVPARKALARVALEEVQMALSGERQLAEALRGQSK